VIPFLPALAGASGDFNVGGSSSKKTETLGDTSRSCATRDPDPISAPAANSGDSGMLDWTAGRVAFQPPRKQYPDASRGGRYGVDLKARAVGDIVTVNVIEAMNSDRKPRPASERPAR